MPIDVIRQDRLPTMHLSFRLNTKDTAILHQRLHDAIEIDRGLSFVLQQMDGSITLNWTKEHGYELQISAWTTDLSRCLTTPLIGYQGRWDHFDLFFNAKPGRQAIEAFFSEVKKLGAAPSGTTYNHYHEDAEVRSDLEQRTEKAPT